MSIDRLKHRIVIQKRVTTKDSFGGFSNTWSTFKSVRAGVTHISGLERNATKHGGEIAEERIEFFIRHLQGVAALMRISYGGLYYNIRHVKPLYDRNQWMVLACDTGVNDGS